LEPSQQSLEPPPKTTIKKPHLEAICIKNPTDEQKFTPEEYQSWSKDVPIFWRPSSTSFIPEETSREPICFIYDATVQFVSQSHGDCLRRRYLALFWFDYFKARYPGREAGFDCEYVDLGHTILGSAVADTEAVVSLLREYVKAGRKYNMLTMKFGDGILLTIPSSVGRTT
jgi:hypothetical protein